MLVEEVRGKILPMRGIQAGADEVLVTLSSTHALQVAGELLVRRGAPVVLGRPTAAAFERRLRERHAAVSMPAPDPPAPMPPAGAGVPSRPPGSPSGPTHPAPRLPPAPAAAALGQEAS